MDTLQPTVGHDLDAQLRSLGLPVSRFHKAIVSAAPVTLHAMRCVVSGFCSAISDSIGEREITQLATLAYDALPWRAEAAA